MPPTHLTRPDVRYRFAPSPCSHFPTDPARTRKRTHTAAIALPSQNPLLRSLKDDAEAGTVSSIPTSKRGLTLDDVLGNLHHHNAGVKKDALGELKDVLVNGVELGVQMGQRGRDWEGDSWCLGFDFQ